MVTRLEFVDGAGQASERFRVAAGLVHPEPRTRFEHEVGDLCRVHVREEQVVDTRRAHQSTLDGNQRLVRLHPEAGVCRVGEQRWF